MKKTSRIWVSIDEKEHPIIKVVDNNKNQILISLVFARTHMTLHLKKDGRIISTHRDENEVIFPEKAYAAKANGYKSWINHGCYYHHQPLLLASGNFPNILAAHLGGVGFTKDDLVQVSVKEKYKRDHKKILVLQNSDNLINVFFTRDGISSNKRIIVLETTLGRVIFAPTKYDFVDR